MGGRRGARGFVASIRYQHQPRDQTTRVLLLGIEWNKSGVSPNAGSGRRKRHGCYEKRKEEKRARKRISRGLGRWLEHPFDVVVAGADEVVDSEVDEICVIDVENPETEDVTDGFGKGVELVSRGEVDSVPTVMVLVRDEVGGFLIDWGMGSDDVAAGSE